MKAYVPLWRSANRYGVIDEINQLSYLTIKRMPTYHENAMEYD
jgi:hypothetical protein